MKTTYLALFSALILLAAGGNSISQIVNVMPLPATYPDVGSAFTAINGGLHGTGVVNVTITGNTTEAVPAVLNGGIFSQCIVTPFGNITVTGNFNDAVIVLNGADRVTIDGINSMGNSLTITNMNAGLSQGCIRMYNGANFNTVRNTTCIGVGVANTSGGRTVNIGQPTGGAGGNDDNTIENCLIDGGRRGIQTFGTIGLYTNSRTIIRNNEIKNFSSIGIFAGTETLDNTIEGNILFYDAPVYNDPSGVRVISVQGCGTQSVLRNRIYGISGTVKGYFTGILTLPVKFTSPLITPPTTTDVINNMVALDNCIDSAINVYGIYIASNTTTTNYNSRVLNNSAFVAGSSVTTVGALNVCIALAQNGTHGPEVVEFFNNISQNERTGGDPSALHVGQLINLGAGVGLAADFNVAYCADTSARGWDALYNQTLYEGTAGQELYKDTLCAINMEQNTAFIYVKFLSPIDLHLFPSQVGANMDAMIHPAVTVDYDGASRAVTGSNPFSYRGADELTGGKKSYQVLFKLEEPQAYPNRVSICLRNGTFPYSIVDCAYMKVRQWIVFNQASVVTLNLGPKIISANYYLETATKHSVRTQSATAVSFLGMTGVYDFTSAQTQSFGNNSVFIGGGWAFYNGDVNQDDFVDATDGSLVDNDSYNFVTGCYLATDVTDDGFVDASDGSIVDNNSSNFVGAVLLPGTGPVDKNNADRKFTASTGRNLLKVSDSDQ